MRICHAISTLDPAAGGPPVVARNLAAALAARDHQVTLLGTTRPERAAEVQSSLQGTQGIEKVDVRVVDVPDSRRQRLLGTWYIDALEQAGPFDLLHFHGMWDPEIIHAAKWARRHGVPLVITPHGMLDYWNMRQKGLKKRLALATVYGRIARQAAAIHALNEHEKAAIERFNFGTGVSVVPNGVFLEELATTTAPNTFRAAHPELGDRPYVLFLGRIQYKKGLDILAKAWVNARERMPDVRLVVVGPREGDVIEVFQKTLSEAGAADSVLVLDPIYSSLKLAAIREAAAFILPSRQEGFSMAITESLALGTPVLISSECHFPEVAEVGAGFIHELDAGRVTDDLIRFFQLDETARGEMGKRGARLVRERYTWPAVAKQFEELYRF